MRKATIDKTTIIWDAQSGECKQQFPFHSGECKWTIEVTVVKFLMREATIDKTTNIWDSQSGMHNNFPSIQVSLNEL